MRPEPIKPGYEETMQEILERYEKRGAVNQFSVRPAGMIECHGCGSEEPAEQAPLIALHRLEGTSDPAAEAAVAAIECPSCGAWGTLVFAYGPAAPPEDAVVLMALLDDRDQSPVTIGK